MKKHSKIAPQRQCPTGYLNAAAAAVYLGFAKSHARTFIQRADELDLQFMRVGGVRIYRKTDLDSYFAPNLFGPAAAAAFMGFASPRAFLKWADAVELPYEIEPTFAANVRVYSKTDIEELWQMECESLMFPRRSPTPASSSPKPNTWAEPGRN